MEQKKNNHLSLNRQQIVKSIQFACDNLHIYWHNTWHDNTIKTVVLLTLNGDEE